MESESTGPWYAGCLPVGLLIATFVVAIVVAVFDAKQKKDSGLQYLHTGVTVEPCIIDGHQYHVFKSPWDGFQTVHLPECAKCRAISAQQAMNGGER